MRWEFAPYSASGRCDATGAFTRPTPPGCSATCGAPGDLLWPGIIIIHKNDSAGRPLFIKRGKGLLRRKLLAVSFAARHKQSKGIDRQ